MTDIFMDGFDHYGVVNAQNNAAGAVPIANMLAGSWAEAIGTGLGIGGGIVIPSWGNPATGAGCIVRYAGNPNSGGSPGYDGVSAYGFRRVLPAPATKLFVSLRFAMDSLPSFSGQMYIMGVSDGSNSNLGMLAVTATGGIELRDYSNTVIAATSGPVLVAHNFHFLEMMWDSSTHTFQLRVDDAQVTQTPVISTTALTFGAPQNIRLFPTVGLTGAAPVNVYIDDLYVRDGTGSVNNSWLGDRRIAFLPVVADSTPQGWTPRFYHEIGAGILNNTNNNALIFSPASNQLDLGAGDFTLEGFFRFNALPLAGGYSTLYSRWDAGNNRRSYQLLYGSSGYNNSSLQFQYTTDGTSSTLNVPIVYPWTPDLNRWYHIAVVRASGELLLFVDGNQLGLPIADSATYFASSAALFAMGHEISGGFVTINSTDFFGWMDEVRMTVGFARYTAPFTPTTVAFPRSVGGDPQFAQVVLLAGFDSSIQDESSFHRSLSGSNASQFTVPDGPSVGNWSTMGKATPNDQTFMSAAFTAATGILTMTTQPSNGDTVTIGTKDGTTPAVYTFKTAISTAFDVLIDTTAQNTLLNLYNAIVLGSGIGTKYGTGTTANFDVTAFQLPAGQLEIIASTAGSAGNSIPTTHTGTAVSFGGTTLSGGANLPGPACFKLARPPVNTTLISAIQLVTRQWKTDSGSCTEQTSLIGPLGGVAAGTAHGLTVSPSLYNDIINTDPDTGSNITPSTLINGKIQINRTL